MYSLVGIDGDQAGIYPMFCKRWECRICGAKKVRRVMGLLNAGMQLGPTRFITLTARGDEDAAVSWHEFPGRWKRFRQRIARRFGAFEYLGVVEAQKRGHPHIHVVYRGQYMNWRVVRGIAKAAGFGKIADIRGTRAATASYLVKYLTKDLRPPSAPAGQPAGGLAGGPAGGPASGPPRYFRRVRMSKGWCVPLEPPAPRWADWRILDGPPAQAQLEVRRRGYQVVECVLGPLVALFQPAAKLRWLRRLGDRWNDKPRRAA